MADVQELADYVAIRQLNARYNRLADSGDGEGYARLYTEDAEFEIAGNKVYRGRVEIAAIAAATRVTVHITTEPEIEIDGDTAHQRVRMLTCLALEDGSRNDFVATGWYVDELRRTAEGWRYRRRRAELDLSVSEIFAKMGMADRVRALAAASA